MDGIVSTWRRSVVLDFLKKTGSIGALFRHFIHRRTRTATIDRATRDSEATKLPGPSRNHTAHAEQAGPPVWGQFRHLRPFNFPSSSLFVFAVKSFRWPDVYPVRSLPGSPGDIRENVQPNADAFEKPEIQDAEPLAVLPQSITEYHMAEGPERRQKASPDDYEVVLFQRRRPECRQLNCSHGTNQGLKYLAKDICGYECSDLKIPALRIKHYLGMDVEQMLTRLQTIRVEGALCRRKFRAIDGALELMYPIEAKMLARKIVKDPRGQVQQDIFAQLEEIRKGYTDDRIRLQHRLDEIELEYKQLKAATQAYFSQGCVEETSAGLKSVSCRSVGGFNAISRGIEAVTDLEQRYQRLFDPDDARQALAAFRAVDSNYRKMYTDTVMWEGRQRYIGEMMRFRARERRNMASEVAKRERRGEKETFSHKPHSRLELQGGTRGLPSTLSFSRQSSKGEKTDCQEIDLEAQRVFMVDEPAILQMEYDDWWTCRTESLRQQRVQARCAFWLKNMRLTREGFVWPDGEHAYIMTMNEDVADLFSVTPADYLPDTSRRDT